MITSASAAQTDWQSGQEVGDLRFSIGYQMNRLGDYLLKAGDRLCGDKPMGVVELQDESYLEGRRSVVGAEILALYQSLDEGRKQQLEDAAQRLLEDQRTA